MRIFGVDVSVKYIQYELNGKQYLVQFRSNLRKGIYDVSVWDDFGETDAKIIFAYPSLRRTIRELVRVDMPIWIKSIRSRKHNRRGERNK